MKKNTIVTFDTRRQVNKKNKTKEKTIDRRNFIDSATDPDDFYDEGELGENDSARLLNTKSNKKKDTRKNKGEQAREEMKTISVMKGKKNKQKLADILSALKVANVDHKKARKAKPKKEDEMLMFHEIPTDDITLTTDDETTGGEQNVKPKEAKTTELEKDNTKKDKPKQQSSVDTIHLDELFSPKKKIEETGLISQGEVAGHEITLDVIQTDANSAKQESDDETSKVIEVPEIYREPEVKFAKINIGGGGGGAAPKKVENSVQQSRSEKKQKRTDSNVSLKSEEKRMSSAGSSSSSSSGAELYVKDT